MASNPDMRLQLIIEAINRSEAAFSKVKKDLLDVGAETTAIVNTSNRAGQAMNEAGNTGAAGMRKIGPAVAAARDHVAAAQKEMPGLLQKFAALQAQYNAINTTGAATGKTLEDAGKKGAAGMDKIHDHAQRAHSMLGQMVQMALIMGTILFARKLADMGIEYNKALEISKLGLSAIITSMGVVTDQQGRVLQGQEKWAASQELAVEAQRELQKIGMLTAASYVELVEVYQGILAPALSAKMTFAETLDITGLLTNSVKTLGLNINQVKQEARDLIQGGITPASSSLATALTITDSMVKKWREQGTVYQELKGRLEGFTYAEREFSNTWEGAWSNFRDMAQRALGEGSKPLFDFMRKEIIKLTGEMTNITKDASGKIIDIQIKPEVVARIRELAEDLKKLIQLMELAVKWGSELAKPLMWGAVALGIGKVALAMDGMYKTIKAGETIAKTGLLMRILTNPAAFAAVVAVMGLGATAVRGYDNVQLSKRADDVREKTGKDGGAPNIDQFQGAQLREVLEKFPDATDDDIVKMIRGHAIKLAAPSFSDRYSAQSYKVYVDQEKGKQLLDAGKSQNNLNGPNKKTDEELKKEKELARTAIEDSYRSQIETIKRGESVKVDAIKTGLKEKELLYKQGGITELELMQAQADSQKNILQASIDAAAAEQQKLDAEWEEKKGTFDPEKRKHEHAAYISARAKLEDEALKKTAELKRAMTDEEIKQLDHSRNLENARREGALKSLQEQLAGEKQLTQLLLEREKITPLEAERRDIATEQSGLEAEYWDVAAKKMKESGDAARIELATQLQLLEQRMDALSQQAPNRLYQAGQETSALGAKREEARISHELADLDAKEATRQVSKPEALRQRQALLEELLASQQAVQDGIDPKDTTAWNTQQAAIDATRQRLLELKLAMRVKADDMAGGLREGLLQYADETGGVFKQMVELSKTTATAMEGAFSDLFFDAMQGKLNGFKDYFNAFLSAIERQLATIMAQKVVMGALGGLGITTQALGGVWEGGVQKFATGGVVLQPTLFPTASGLGLMGEAGAEAIMPLARTASGHLGVRALAGSGGSAPISVSVGGITVENGGASGDVDMSRAIAIGGVVNAAITQALIREKRPGGLLN